ncbi:hypothetical protein BS50DRAFT_264510 [Corynespora cassiicola Philippines]|uniref:Uncharacterized protein n=1 Tax=Corynespora cassiicola Philippines TaxID=1448308 RepID=A0A2T2NYV5_CORCC|nr:hypothetical protein BS50DRAFT_264510 [Corynespora cassiicola Philippines]
MPGAVVVVAVDDKSWTETKSTTARCNAQRLSISALGATVRRSAIEAGRLPPRIREDRHGDGQVSGSEASEAAAGWLRAVQHQAAGDRHVDAPRRPRPGIWRGSMWAGGRQAAMAPSITTAAQCNGWAWCVCVVWAVWRAQGSWRRDGPTAISWHLCSNCTDVVPTDLVFVYGGCFL